jgi:hypothetical protein
VKGRHLDDDMSPLVPELLVRRSGGGVEEVTGGQRVVQCVEGFLVQFVVMRLPPVVSVIWGCLGGNSMGLILDARNVSFSGSEGSFLLALAFGLGLGERLVVLGRTSQIHQAIYVQVMK